jgi:hypothetical protein
MKNLLFLALLSIGLLSSCKDDNQDSTVLPEATQSGKNTAGAIINGKVWVATTKKINQPGTYCENSGNRTNITLELRQIENQGRNSISITAIIEDLELNKIYPLSEDPDTGYKFAIYTDNNLVNYGTNSTNTGTIKITRLDLQNHIVSGIFEFKAVNNNGNVITVTEGRFDKKFD